MDARHRTDVLVVDEPGSSRDEVWGLLARRPELSVRRTSAADAEAYAFDVVAVSVESQGSAGLALIRRLLAIDPHRKIIVLTDASDEGADATLGALDAGAADFVCRTERGGAAEVAELAKILADKIHDLGNGVRTAQRADIDVARRTAAFGVKTPEILAIGASTGGPHALQQVLSALPPAVDVPIVVVQHMPDGYFLALLAERLGERAQRFAKVAEHGEALHRRHIYMAPWDSHLGIVRSGTDAIVNLDRAPREHFARPAVNPLFRSVAQVYGPAALAVVLTGMGEDGRAGAARVVGAGGRVLVQDEATSIIWGMPGAVARAGLATAVLALDEIGPWVAAACSPDPGTPNSGPGPAAQVDGRGPRTRDSRGDR